MGRVIQTINRRWQRQRRRKAVGRAYDMALEISRLLPANASVLDVGCGNGFIAHHLASILRSRVVGLDVGDSTQAHIPYLRYDGRNFAVQDQTFDAVLLCYVLHHAQNCNLVLAEIRRVLNPGGLVVVYEDMPAGWWNKTVCWTHDRKWRSRTGPCTFQLEDGWRGLFSASGFEIVSERPLSRWRNLTHPVSRRLYLLRVNNEAEIDRPSVRKELVAAPRLLPLPIGD
jgi:ubiquinone/menaquinone biosynthesis C-methylase UbiE